MHAQNRQILDQIRTFENSSVDKFWQKVNKPLDEHQRLTTHHPTSIPLESASQMLIKSKRELANPISRRRRAVKRQQS